MCNVFWNFEVSLKISNACITRARGGKKERQKWVCARELPPALRVENSSPMYYLENFFKTFPHNTQQKKNHQKILKREKPLVRMMTMHETPTCSSAQKLRSDSLIILKRNSFNVKEISLGLNLELTVLSHIVCFRAPQKKGVNDQKVIDDWLSSVPFTELLWPCPEDVQGSKAPQKPQQAHVQAGGSLGCWKDGVWPVPLHQKPAHVVSGSLAPRLWGSCLLLQSWGHPSKAPASCRK